VENDSNSKKKILSLHFYLQDSSLQIHRGSTKIHMLPLHYLVNFLLSFQAYKSILKTFLMKTDWTRWPLRHSLVWLESPPPLPTWWSRVSITRNSWHKFRHALGTTSVVLFNAKENVWVLFLTPLLSYYLLLAFKIQILFPLANI